MLPVERFRESQTYPFVVYINFTGKYGRQVSQTQTIRTRGHFVHLLIDLEIIIFTTSICNIPRRRTGKPPTISHQVLGNHHHQLEDAHTWTTHGNAPLPRVTNEKLFLWNKALKIKEGDYQNWIINIVEYFKCFLSW